MIKLKILLRYFWRSSKFIDIMKIREKLDLTEVNDTIITSSLITAEDVLSFLNIFSYTDKKTKSCRVNVEEITKYCNIEIIKTKVDDLLQEYNGKQVVENFLEGYKLFNES